MLVSLNWLKELVPTNAAAAALDEALTMAGLEVESVEDAKPDFDGVVIGHLLKISSHPNADKLVLCEVDVGGPEPLGIVCGATNIKEGDKVPVAVVGSTLTGGFKIKKAKLRGEVSEGMMCSARELGLGEDHEGIMILSPDVNVGDKFDEAMGLNDIVIELGITPNRPDCLSMIGVAREVAAWEGLEATEPEFEIPEHGPDISSITSVTIDDDDGCPRYAARVVEGVKIGPSPSWMREKLIKVGLRPLNNVVDITNYVLMELGHPLHAFDYDKLGENRIVVRRAGDGEPITTLDGVERKLSKDTLVIADAMKPVAIAGVMGGTDSEVTDQTTTILIESAYFDPVSIRRTSKSLGLSTEASYRFERGADPEMAITALDRAASFVAELAGGKIAKGRIDEYPKKIERPEIKLRYARVGKILGIEIAGERAISILSSLGFEIISEGSEAADIRAPSFRPDITAEIDLIEEIARIHGYDKIASTYPRDNTVGSRAMRPASFEEISRGVLASAGFFEVVTYSFGEPKRMADFTDKGTGAEPIKMKNPLAEDASVMRTTIIPGILETLRSNVNAGNKDLKIFETGKVYFPAPGDPLPDERTFVCGAVTGLSHPVSWKGTPAEADFFDLKGAVEVLIEALGADGVRATKAANAGFHPGMCADIVAGGETIGKIGEIHPAILDKYEIDQKAFVFEIDLDGIEAGSKAEGGYEKFSRFPSADRDLAVVVDEGVEAAAVYEAIMGAGGKTLCDGVLFDVYRGKQIDEGKKSLAFGLRFQSRDRTLTDEEIAAASKNIMKALEKKFDARLRA